VSIVGAFTGAVAAVAEVKAVSTGAIAGIFG